MFQTLKTMDPISLARQFLTATFTLAQTIGTGSLGDTYTLSLHSWRTSYTDVRGEFYVRYTKKFETPGFAILSVSQGSFLEEDEYGILNEDGSVEIAHRDTSIAPFSITQASRENWNCDVPGINGPLAHISKMADFRLLLVGTIPKPTSTLTTLGGWARMHLRFPGSKLSFSPCTSLPDFTGQNILAAATNRFPRTEPVLIRPANMKGTTVIPVSARVIIQPQRVNWIYWDAPEGFGPTIVFEGYGAAPSVKL